MGENSSGFAVRRLAGALALVVGMAACSSGGTESTTSTTERDMASPTTTSGADTTATTVGTAVPDEPVFARLDAEWRLIDSPFGAAQVFNRFVAAVEPGADGVWTAVGNVIDSLAGPKAAVWTSSDRVTWSEPILLTSDPHVAAVAAERAGQQVVVIGESDTGTVAWVGTGDEYETVELSGLDSAPVLFESTPDGGLVAVTYADRRSVVSGSGDGVVWTALGEVDSSRPRSLAVTDAGIFLTDATGVYRSDGDGSWEAIAVPETVVDVAVVPSPSGDLLLVGWGFESNAADVFRFEAPGGWDPVEFPEYRYSARVGYDLTDGVLVAAISPEVVVTTDGASFDLVPDDGVDGAAEYAFGGPGLVAVDSAGDWIIVPGEISTHLLVSDGSGGAIRIDEAPFALDPPMSRVAGAAMVDGDLAVVIREDVEWQPGYRRSDAGVWVYDGEWRQLDQRQSLARRAGFVDGVAVFDSRDGDALAVVDVRSGAVSGVPFDRQNTISVHTGTERVVFSVDFGSYGLVPGSDPQPLSVNGAAVSLCAGPSGELMVTGDINREDEYHFVDRSGEKSRLVLDEMRPNQCGAGEAGYAVLGSWRYEDDLVTRVATSDDGVEWEVTDAPGGPWSADVVHPTERGLLVADQPISGSGDPVLWLWDGATWSRTGFGVNGRSFVERNSSTSIDEINAILDVDAETFWILGSINGRASVWEVTFGG